MSRPAWLASLLALGAASYCSAAPTDYFWNTTADGNYADGANWTPTGPPTDADNANFNLGSSGYTVTLSAPGSVRAVNIANDTVTMDLGSNSLTAEYVANPAPTSIAIGANGGDTGSLTVTNGTLIGPSIVVGGAGTGNLSIQNSGQVAATSTLRAGGTGSQITVDGSGSALFAGPTIVGSGGNASLTVQNAANVGLYTLEIGDHGTGGVVFDGANTLVGFSGGLVTVGSQTGSGTLVFQNGVQVANSASSTTNRFDISIGKAADATGVVTATDAGTKVLANVVNVGENGQGTLNVLNGAQFDISGAATRVAANAGSTGALKVDGAGSAYNSTGDVRIGNANSDSAALDVTNGGTLKATWYYAGGSAASPSVTNVTGTGSSLTASSELAIGFNGAAKLNVANGGQVVTEQLYIAAQNDGAVTVDGAGSVLQLNSDAIIGRAGAGSLLVQNGGSLVNGAGVTTRRFVVGEETNGTVTLDGPTTQANTDSQIQVGLNGSGQLRLINGAKWDNAGNSVTLGVNAGSAGEMIVDGAGSAFVTLGNVAVGPGGAATTVRLLNGGSLQAGTANLFAQGNVIVDAASHLTAAINNAGRIQNDGLITGDVVNQHGGILSGSGVIDGTLTLNSGSVLAPGDSPGTLTAGDTTWNGGATYQVEINSALGTAGQDPGWDLFNVTGTLTLNGSTGNRMFIALDSLGLDNLPGNLGDFDPLSAHSWLIATTSGGIANFAQDSFWVNAAGFDGGLYQNHFFVSQSGNDLYLNYSVAAIPEPGALALLGLGAAILFLARRRRLTAPRHECD